jgi:hypothetical protein
MTTSTRARTRDHRYPLGRTWTVSNPDSTDTFTVTARSAVDADQAAAARLRKAGTIAAADASSGELLDAYAEAGWTATLVPQVVTECPDCASTRLFLTWTETVVRALAFEPAGGWQPDPTDETGTIDDGPVLRCDQCRTEFDADDLANHALTLPPLPDPITPQQN